VRILTSHKITPTQNLILVHNLKQNSEKGSSLIELMFVIVVILVVSGFALIRLDRARNSQQRENVAVQLKSHLERARYDAIKRRATPASGLSSVTINQTSFSLQIDLNQNGMLETNESKNFIFDSSVSGKFVGNLNFPVKISFDRHGRVTTVDNNDAEINSVLTLCSENCFSTNNSLVLTNQNSSVISVSKTGTVTIKPGDVTTELTTNSGFLTNESTVSPADLMPDDPNVVVNQFIKVQNSY
jgi:Tfp pilus assembly protein FimT